MTDISKEGQSNFYCRNESGAWQLIFTTSEFRYNYKVKDRLIFNNKSYKVIRSESSRNYNCDDFFLTATKDVMLEQSSESAALSQDPVSINISSHKG